MILAVVKDPGGTNGVLPVVKVLRGESFKFDVRLIANGSAVKLLSDTTENYEALHSADEVSMRYPNPSIMLTSMCSDGGVGRDLVPLLRGTCPTVAFHDYWGTRLFPEWHDPKYRPDFFVVNDELDANIVMGAWPDYKREQFIVSGYPMFDQYAVKYDQTELLTSISSRLGIDAANKPIVLSAYGIYKGVNKFLSEVIDVLNDLNLDIYFIPRFHPRMKLNVPEEVELCNQVLKRFNGGTLVESSSACTTQELLRASTVVLSDYSTTLLEATLLRKPNISACYLEEIKVNYQVEFGTVQKWMPDPPFVMLGCSAKAVDKISLGQHLSDAIHGKLNLKSAQEKYFALDGQNAKRAAEKIASLI
ncbi:CDP-glycerol glycerophosphotransferase family protein [Candidatus Woesearchaeota archaeon]|uniref:UDP-N-acetylglucosamine 2-epimerase domain-containing protein n=2 Tax=Parcubacteria group TaxID=1794811 RepID=A0A1F8HTJ9_9BACT|nr:MAG: hypothetical protein UU83_C0020G0002 [Candidatus Jorgensenbacteria bacterium GW2011_GWF2_41_8]MBS3161918.1 CDP-glycerol glycerophosphotransferase family protein [Candidatus Woesearchaeota archaeon]OGN40458.1 MAG: hypothetical protein A2606_01695 [Candidatus Yanofskybacteria bacterium RIFOXYD1_FULL_42_10]